MAQPYVKKDAGDIIRAQDWNDLQSQARDEILGHLHTGGPDGRLLGGASIDATTTLKVARLEVSGDLLAKARSLLEEIDQIIGRVTMLEAKTTFTGPLSVTGVLMASGGIVLGDAVLRLRGSDDASHGLSWRPSFGTVATLDGPVLTGRSGGALGIDNTEGARASLNWTAKDVTVRGELNVTGAIQSGGVLAMSDHEIRLRGAADAIHGLGYRADIDGPYLWGHLGGALGSAEAGAALTWRKAGPVVIQAPAGAASDQAPYLPSHLRLAQGNQDKTGGKAIFLELYQDDPGNEVNPVYPSIRFHHHMKYTQRLEAREDGLHVKDGHVTSDDYRALTSGDLNLASSALYFTGTDHRWTPPPKAGQATIQNSGDPQYNALMIIGRSTGSRRDVGIWDYLKVNGSQEITGNLAVTGQINAGNLIAMSDHDIRLRGPGDGNHGLGFRANLDGTALDGPLLWGNVGGALGTSGNPASLRWTRNGPVTIHGPGVMNNDEVSYLRLMREGGTSGGKAIYLELFQGVSGGNNPLPVYPSIRFHHQNRFWQRLEAREDGLHVKDGTLTNDNYRSITASSHPSVSDIALKTDVKPLTRAREAVTALRPVRFRWRDPGMASGHVLGLVAQEVEAVLPEVVSTGSDGLKSVNYSGLVPLLIRALQEQQIEIDRLTASLTRH